MNLRQKNKALKRQVDMLKSLNNAFMPAKHFQSIDNVKVEEYKVAIPLDPSTPPDKVQVYNLKSRIVDSLMIEIQPIIEYKLTEQAMYGIIFIGKRYKE